MIVSLTFNLPWISWGGKAIRWFEQRAFLQSFISSTVWNAYFYLIAWGTVRSLTQTHYATESQTLSPLILVFICVFGFPLEFADSTCRFFCSIYFAEQFRLLRKRIFADGEEKYELHFVIDYMNRSYETRKLLYSLIPRTPIPRPGGGGYTPEDF